MATDKVKDFARGSLVALTWSGISFLGTTPADSTGLTFQVIVKDPQADEDAPYLFEASTGDEDITVTDNPLVVTARIPTDEAEFVANVAYAVELWVWPAAVSKWVRIKEANLILDATIKQTFIQPT